MALSVVIKGLAVRGYKMQEEICKNCEHHKYVDIDTGFICVSKDSDCYANWTPSNYGCNCFDVKKDYRALRGDK